MRKESRDEGGEEGGEGRGKGVVEVCQDWPYFSDLLPQKSMLIPDWPGNLTDLQKCLHCLGVASCHDDLVGVNVVE